MKNKTLLIGSVFIAVMLCSSLAALGAGKKSASPSSSASPAAASASASPATARSIPFHGMCSAVDKKAKTFAIAGKEKSRVFKVTDKTMVTKAGQPAKLEDMAENTEISGSYWKQADGSLEAKTVKIGAIGEKKETTKKEKASATSSASPSASPKK